MAKVELRMFQSTLVMNDMTTIILTCTEKDTHKFFQCVPKSAQTEEAADDIVQLSTARDAIAKDGAKSISEVEALIHGLADSIDRLRREVESGHSVAERNHARELLSTTMREMSNARLLYRAAFFFHGQKVSLSDRKNMPPNSELLELEYPEGITSSPFVDGDRKIGMQVAIAVFMGTFLWISQYFIPNEPLRIIIMGLLGILLFRWLKASPF